MGYRLVYHPAVLSDDLPPINRNLQSRIMRSIEGRLTTEPTLYGEPLRHRLKGYWKLRVGDYRVVYQLVGQEVWILRIDHRRDVYSLPLQRLSWHP
jgi:mRNA interferase RelE/StbE